MLTRSHLDTRRVARGHRRRERSLQARSGEGRGESRPVGPRPRAPRGCKYQAQQPGAPSERTPLTNPRSRRARPLHLPQILSPSFLVHPWATPHQVSYAGKQERGGQRGLGRGRPGGEQRRFWGRWGRALPALLMQSSFLKGPRSRVCGRTGTPVSCSHFQVQSCGSGLQATLAGRGGGGWEQGG